MNIICAIYDEKAQAYFGIHEAPTAGHAIRAFGDHVQSKQSPLSRHPGDYKLYKLGSFDPTSALATFDKNPIYLSVGSDFVQSTTQPVPTATFDQKDRNLNSNLVDIHN